MTTSAVKNNLLPPGLVSNLQEVLLSRKSGGDEQPKDNADKSTEPTSSASNSDAVEPNSELDGSKPIVLVTNADGIDSPGLTYLVEALVRDGLYNVHVCAPQTDKSLAGHSMTLRETIAVSSAEISGATAYEVSGTPVDCVSLAISGALFAWSKPLLVLSGINRGSSCGHHVLSSGVVAGAREALISGVPSISISLNWKKDESRESDFKDAVAICIPLINAAIRDIEKGVFPGICLLNMEVPTSPLTNKGFKVTKQSLHRSTLCWQAIPANRHPSAAGPGRFMSNQQSLGMQLAQLSRDASAAGAARRFTTQKKNVEIESVGAAGKSDSNRTVKYFRLELLDKDQAAEDVDQDFGAVENGYVSVTPLSLSSDVGSFEKSISDWIEAALQQLKS